MGARREVVVFLRPTVSADDTKQPCQATGMEESRRRQKAEKCVFMGFKSSLLLAFFCLYVRETQVEGLKIIRQKYSNDTINK